MKILYYNLKKIINCIIFLLSFIQKLIHPIIHMYIIRSYATFRFSIYTYAVHNIRHSEEISPGKLEKDKW